MSQDFDQRIIHIISDGLGKQVIKAQAFTTGLSHYVFDVETDDHLSYVVRLAPPERRLELKQGLYWQAKLEQIGVPLPKIYRTGELDGHAFVIYERLPGDDLEHLYPTLSSTVRQRLACTVAEIQQKIGTLDDPSFHSARPWMAILHTILERSEREIASSGLCDGRYVGIARTRMAQHGDYWAAVRPVAFLYDLNVRNVIVDHEQVSGIIDVDEMWFGDSLLAIGRGKTLLQLMQQDTDYITAWCEYLKLSERQLRVVDFYALLYCVRFMGTVGQRLNGNPNVTTDPGNIPLLEHLAQNLCANP